MHQGLLLFQVKYFPLSPAFTSLRIETLFSEMLKLFPRNIVPLSKRTRNNQTQNLLILQAFESVGAQTSGCGQSCSRNNHTGSHRPGVQAPGHFGDLCRLPVPHHILSNPTWSLFPHPCVTPIYQDLSDHPNACSRFLL